MGVFTIIKTVLGFGLGTKNVKGKLKRFWGGFGGSTVIYFLLEVVNAAPDGFFERMEDFDIPSYYAYLIAIFFVVWSFKEDIKNLLYSILTPNGRRDAKNEKLKDIEQELTYKVNIAKIKKELYEVEQELAIVTKNQNLKNK